MDSVVAAHMAIAAEWYRQKVRRLTPRRAAFEDVMRVTRPGLATYSARQFLDPHHVTALNGIGPRHRATHIDFGEQWHVALACGP